VAHATPRASIESRRTTRLRFAILLLLASAAAFVLGTQVLVHRREPLVHPLTGRVIAGMATNVAWLDRAGRQPEEAPDRALDLIGIAPGMAVADIGAGSGYMTLRLARLTGPSGRVYANDIQPAMLRTIEMKTAQLGVTNVDLVLGVEDDARLPPNSVDLALLVDVYHELRRPQAMLRSIRRSLRPNGRLVVIEYRKEDSRLPIAKTHRMSVAEARIEIEAEGFVLDHVIESLPRQHLIVFRNHGRHP
jgi:ubiquinone/menaquinone biosynthesis C-methylase UbiE